MALRSRIEAAPTVYSCYTFLYYVLWFDWVLTASGVAIASEDAKLWALEYFNPEPLNL